jgi:hypothetical protein
MAWGITYYRASLVNLTCGMKIFLLFYAILVKFNRLDGNILTFRGGLKK